METTRIDGIVAREVHPGIWNAYEGCDENGAGGTRVAIVAHIEGDWWRVTRIGGVASSINVPGATAVDIIRRVLAT